MSEPRLYKLKTPREREGSSPELSSALELRALSHRFPSTREDDWVLRDLSLEIRQNEFVSIVGPSGCGKSTLLFILAGFMSPTAGEALHLGEVIQGPSRTRGVVFQSDAVFPWLRVRQNVEFGLRAAKVGRLERDRVVSRYLELVELTAYADRWPKELSGGMRKRVDVARAYAGGADVLLLDEPFGMLDVRTKEQMQLALAELWRQEHRTIVFVTHDIEEAIFLADRVVVMGANPGRFIEVAAIPFERPRVADLKLDAEFVGLRRQCDLLLRQSER